MVILGHVRPRHRYRGTPIAVKRRMCPDQAKIEKGQARDALKDQGRGLKAVRCRVPRSGHIPQMGGQHSTSAEKGWKSTDVCRLSGFE